MMTVWQMRLTAEMWESDNVHGYLQVWHGGGRGADCEQIRQACSSGSRAQGTCFEGIEEQGIRRAQPLSLRKAAAERRKPGGVWMPWGRGALPGRRWTAAVSFFDTRGVQIKTCSGQERLAELGPEVP